ncbi:uridylate-specific endoribonuclease B [Tachysurus vachellii]|uniref:uridylate-specific endoribonuclease B n=1 Tax=Tachysurus vachellii TaxID=175792 RepID=UPI00296B0D55|nr:uridylate-specific endoribonuclease B [Tachysurus vachellii]
MIEHDPDLSAVAQELWDNDIHRLRPGTDYCISLQNKAAHLSDLNDGNQAAGSPLFTYVDETIFKKETFLAFISLLDNYESDTGVPEVVTPEEEEENLRFLDSMIKTPVMKIVHNYLVKKKLSASDTSVFKEQLHHIWFELYARRGSSRPDSSGFEHVFVGETRGGHTVIGFHNWIQLYLQEKLGHIDYKGYSIKVNSPEPDENKHILALQFIWKNGIKPKGSIFLGVSPEFEFALYTLCFITSPNERVRVSFSLYDMEIVCHHYNQKHIGTTYPVLIRYRDVQ